MRKRRKLGCVRAGSLLAVLACVIAGGAAGAAPAWATPDGDAEPQPAFDADGPFGVEAVAATDSVPCGGSTEIGFLITVPAGYHIYPDTLAAEPEERLPDGVRFDSVRVPEGELEHVQAFAVLRRELRGPARVPVRVKLSISGGFFDPRSTVELRAAVRYQGCADGGSCFAPGRDVFPFRFAVVAPDATPRALRPDVFGPDVVVLPADGAAVAPEAAPTAEQALALEAPAGADSGAASGGVLDFATIRARYGDTAVYLAIYLSGLLLCLTPCVFPMVTITASVFGSRVEKAGGGKFLRLMSPLVYGLGIGLTYGALGLGFSFAGTSLGIAMENPWVLGFLIVVFLGLALSMFGLYDIQPPKFVLRRYDNAAQATGLVATFLMGLLGGLVAAPCAGPWVFALAAYIAAQKDAFASPVQHFLFGGSAFFVLGLGLASPFMVLGLFTGLATSVPRPGAWMLSVKRFFGVVMVGVALFFGRTLLKNVLDATGERIHAWLVCIFLLAVGGFGGGLDSLAKEAKPFDRARRLFGVVCLALGIYYLIINVGGASGAAPSGGIDWIASEGDGLARARAEGKPAFIDFYADWCAPCQQMDKDVFEDPRVVEAVRARFVAIRADVTTSSDANAALRAKYNALPPFLVFFDSRGERVMRPRGYIGGEVLDPEEFLRMLEAIR